MHSNPADPVAPTSAREQAPWLIYAMGGGYGHLTRALALANAAQRAGHRCQILANAYAVESCPALLGAAPGGPSRPRASGAGNDDATAPPQLIALHSIGDTRDNEEAKRRVRAFLRHTQHSVLVVDTFPRGILGELAESNDLPEAPRVLVHRDLNPEYVRRFDLRAVAARYDSILLPGERGPLSDLKNTLFTPPWVNWESHQLWTREEARTRFQLDERPAVAVLGSGRADEITELRRAHDELSRESSVQSCFIDPLAAATCPPQHIMLALRGFDLVVGQGGYNTTYEARACGVPLLAFARPRLYDRQALRLTEVERLDSTHAIVERCLDRLSNRRPRHTGYENGAHAAVEHIANLS